MKQEARFLTGSTMRHVIVMTMTGMIGLTFLFLVDAVTLFWVSQLNREVLMAAMGYAWTVQFFTISASVGADDSNLGDGLKIHRAQAIRAGRESKPQLGLW